MLKTTFVELLLYGALLLIWNGLSAHSNHLSYTCCCGCWYVLDCWYIFLLDAWPLCTISMLSLVGCDKGRTCFIQCGLVIMMYLIATSHLALQWTFVQGVTNDKTQETTYIYLEDGSSWAQCPSLAIILITGCIMVSRYHNYTHLSERFDASFGVDLVVLVFLLVREWCLPSFQDYASSLEWVQLFIIIVKNLNWHPI